MMNAPKMTPSLLPCPPSTTAHRNSIELMMLKFGRRDELHLAGVQRTGQPADRRADHERPQLEPEGVDAHDLGGVLVLADRDPGPADPAAFQVADQQQDDDHQDHAEPEPPGAVVRRRPSELPLENTPSGSSSLSPSRG